MPTTTTTKPSGHALLPLLLLLLAASAAAQPNDQRDRSDDDNGWSMSPGARARQQPPSFSAPMVVLLVALIAVFFFIGFFSIYIRQCGRGGAPGPAIPAAALLALSRQEQQNGQQQQRTGLDPALVASFPTMTYAEARAIRVRDEGKGKGDDMAVLECAVCLSEFDDDEELRLLPKCSHAFHPDCIGEWLAGHVTCPVCRCSLKPEEHEEVEPAAAAAAAEANGSGEEQQDQVAIDVNEEEEERRREEEEATELDRIGSQRRAVRRSRSGRWISRAHSTGHSLSLSARRPRLDGGDLERFTLRLPEQVRREMEAESLRRTVAREGSRAARSARIGRSDRWQQQSFIARTFSSSRVPFWGAASRRTPPDAEAGAGGVLPAGSTTTTPATTTAQGRAIREKTGDGSAGSAKLGSVRFDCLGGGGAVAADDSENEAEEEKAIVRRV